ncbi:MBL fold metallo-hydrolase [Bacillus thuringiensis]|nr:MBL fold metallo-hydrolase [Bacillus thuringiensis]
MDFVEKIPLEQSNLYIIKQHNLGRHQRTGLYIYIEGTDVTLIETCGSPPFRYILAGLSELQIELKQVKNIIVTHANLDYGGSIRLLMNSCPNAKLFVHPDSSMYMSNPIELITNKNSVYNYNSTNILNYPIAPVPKEHIYSVQDSEVIGISNKRQLKILYTPGCTRYHISIYDPIINAIYTGDIIGAYFQEERVELYLPAISLTQFDLKKMVISKNKIQQLRPKYIFFGHYGVSSNVTEVYRQFDYWLTKFVDLGKWILKKEKDVDKAINAVSQTIHEEINLYLTSKNVSMRHPVYEKIKLEIDVCAAGIIIYLQNEHIYTINNKV